MYNALRYKVLPVTPVWISITDYIGVRVDPADAPRLKGFRWGFDAKGEPGRLIGKHWVRLADVVMECFPGWARYRGPDKLDCRRENLVIR